MEFLNNTAKPVKPVSTTAKLLIAVTGGLAVGLSVVCASFVAPAFRRYCLPYVPATSKQISNVLAYVPKESNGKLLDLGSGDGRIVIAAAKTGIMATGVELNPWLVIYSKLSAMCLGVRNRTQFYRRDLWKFNIKPYEYIVIFGVEQMMHDLERKLVSEAHINGKIIACRFPLPNIVPQKIREDGVDTVWFYEMNSHRKTQNNST